MTPASSKESRILYHHCPSCGLWCASPYDADLMRYGTLRTVSGAPRRQDSAFSAIKARLERWLRAKHAAPDESPADAPVRSRAASRR
jgi:hypothetical protein